MQTKDNHIINRGTAFSVVLIFTALAIFGLFFVPLLSVQLQPSKGNMVFNITTYWGNTSPIIVETQLTSKLEGALNRLQGIKKISSASSKGRSSITIEVDKYTDPAKLRLDIASTIRRIYPKLPEDAGYPALTMNTPDKDEEKPLMIYTLHGADNGFTLQEYAKNHIKTKLALIEGVNKITVYGGTGYRLQIAYNRNEINGLNILPQDISKAINIFFNQQPLGTVITGDSLLPTANRFTVKLNNIPDTTVKWKNIPVKKVQNRIILLGDIAEITKVNKEVFSYFRINGQDAVNIVIQPEKRSNAIKVAQTITDKIAAIKNKLPKTYQLELSYNATEYIQNELSKIYKRTGLTLLILLVFVFLVSFNIRYVILIILSLFTNLTLSFILYYLAGVEIHLYSLAGITVSLGLIIDNSIVMTDHLVYRGNMKVFTALLASTLTTLGSLSVIWFLPDTIRFKLWDFALIIIINLSVSLVVSLFYIPALLRLMPIKTKKNKTSLYRKKLLVKINSIYTSIIRLLLKYKPVAITALILLFGLPVYLLPNKIDKENLTAKIYNSTLGNDWYVDNLKPYVNKYLGGTLRLFTYYVFENSYFTERRETKLFVQASMPKGATIKQLNDIFVNMERYMLQYRDKVSFYSKIYSPQNAEMVISFKNEDTDQSFPYYLKSRLIARSLNTGGVNWNIYGVGKGFSASVETRELINYQVALYGYNYDELEDIALVFKEKLEKNPRVRNVNIAGSKYWWERVKSYDYFAVFDEDAINFRKTNLYEVYQGLKNKTLQAGIRFTVFNGKNYEEVNIVPDDIDKTDKWNLLNMPVNAISYALNRFLKITKEPEQQTIYKENQSYLRVIEFQYLGSSKFGDKHLNNVLKQMKNEMPPGYSAKRYNFSFNNKKQTISYITLIIIIVAIIYVICSILFESLLRPFAIILTIPFSFIGVFLIFYLFDLNFDQGGYASFILVSGLVVNSSIYLLNEYDQLKSGNKRNALSLYTKAFNHKIVPILLTIGSTVLGLIPFLTFGKAEPFWFALAAGTIGGLLFSIIIIVFYLPLFILKRKAFINKN